ncbi:MAG: VWA domain-containing protein [Arcobacter sp.]|nr:MAG: VWA domain-containing protein [Arcobacter sp.]
MSLLYPIFIYLILPLVLVLFYFIITGSKQSFLDFDKEVLDRLRKENKNLSTKARNSLFLISFVLMILAMSQPVIKDGEIVVEAKSADILIAIDISDSMKAEDAYPNRLELSKHKAIELIKMAPHNRIGVLAFAKHDYIVSPLSFDHSSVAFLLSKVNTKNITEKGTHLDSMLRSAISMLDHADTKNLLLFTDGGDKNDFSKEIELAKDNGLRLFIIGMGTSKGSPVRNENGSFVKHKGNILISKLNDKIKDLALSTGGVYIESVLGDEDILTMLEEIEAITEKSTLKEETIPQYTQLFYYPLALSLFFLLLAFSSVPTRWAKTLILLGFITLGYDDARAGLLDFKKLQDAKEAYANKDYKTSSATYESFAMDSPEAVYNLGNSLYKEGNYERALKIFNEVGTKDKQLKSQALYNAANTEVKLKQYEEALNSYEKALELKEDKQTRENYETLKKFLEEKKKQEQKDKEEENKDNQDKKDQENKDIKKEDSKKDSDKEKESKDKKDQQKSENQEEKNKDSKEQKEENKSEDKDKSKEAKKPQDEKSDKKEEDKKPLEKSDKQKAEEEAAEVVNTKQMSELEAKKWIKLIKKSQKGHLYKMQDLEHEEDTNEKPW